jgi:hypothetical protein
VAEGAHRETNGKRGAATGTFVVECYWPDMTEEHVEDALERLARSGGEGPDRDPVRSLGCILVPSDGMALFLFRGPSSAMVRDHSEKAEVPFDRIVESIQIGLGASRAGPAPPIRARPMRTRSGRRSP